MKSKPTLPIAPGAHELAWATAREPQLAQLPVTPPSLPARGTEIGLWLDAHVDVDAWLDACEAERG
jgi:hypothetical protein